MKNPHRIGQYQREKINQTSMNGWTCPKTGKVAYVSRAAAKKVRNKLPGGGLSIFPCGEHYHLGHGGARPREEHRKLHSD